MIFKIKGGLLMLIKCPECGKEISDKSKQCIHCGYPLEENKKDENNSTLTKVNGDLYSTPEEISNEREELLKKRKQKLQEIDAKKPKTYSPKCPTCGSPNIEKISTTERAVSVVGLGLFSKKINKSFKCKNCGYMW